MPIAPEKVLGAVLPESAASWTQDDVILYHLALGAGGDATAPGELEYVYEAGLKVLPTYGVIPMFPSLKGLTGLDGLNVNFARMLHGEHELEIHQPVPAEGAVTTTGRITDLLDKGKAAVATIELTSRLDDGTLLFTNRMTAFFRGEGGFGSRSDPAPDVQPPTPPDRLPDAVVEVTTLPQQALLYRLTGDKNPVHADPALAAAAGFDRPILHGLCTYGTVCRAAVEALLDGDVGRVGAYRARFAGVVFPGETLVVRAWREHDRVLLEAHSQERSSLILSHAAITLR